MQVNNNGLISFSPSPPLSVHVPKPFSLGIGLPLVAPFWADVDTRGTGAVWIRNTSDVAILNKAEEDIQRAFSNEIIFEPEFAFIATWDGVGYFDSHTDKVSEGQHSLEREREVASAQKYA